MDSFGTVYPAHDPLGLPLRGRQKERKRCEVYSVSKAIEKAPSLSLPKNERAYALKNLIFYKIFEFKKNSRYLPTDV